MSRLDELVQSLLYEGYADLEVSRDSSRQKAIDFFTENATIQADYAAAHNNDYATALMMVALLVIVERRNPLHAALYSAAVVALTYVTFVYVLKTPLNTGPFGF